MAPLRLGDLTLPELTSCTQATFDDLEQQALALLEDGYCVYGDDVDPIAILCCDPRLEAEGDLASALRARWEATRDPRAGFLLALMSGLTTNEQLRLLHEAAEASPGRGQRQRYVCEGLVLRPVLAPPIAAYLARAAMSWPGLAAHLLARHADGLPADGLPALVLEAGQPAAKFTNRNLTQMPMPVLLARLVVAEVDKTVDDATIVRWRTVIAALPDSPFQSVPLALLSSPRREVREVGLKQLSGWR